MGLAWSDTAGGCDPCPVKGSTEFERMCLEIENFVDLKNVNECNLRSDLCPNGICIDDEKGKKVI